MKTFKNIRPILVCLLVVYLVSSKIYAQVSVEFSVRIAPPPIPFYTQPPCPVEDYLWTPGYWSYDEGDYYWVPGVWVRPPRYGFWWTPGYWGYNNGYYGYHHGYWGPHVGYYGGVNYGHGYGGSGFHGGRWEGKHFHYNTAVVNVNRSSVHHTYAERRREDNNNRCSYNGPGGVRSRPTHQEEVYMRDKHTPPTSDQSSHQQGARRDRNQFAKVNRGRPATATMNRVGGDGYDPRGQHASGHSDAGRNQPNNRREQTNRAVSPANNNRREQTNRTSNNAHSAQPSKQHNASPSTNNRREQTTHSANPANNRREQTHSTAPSNNAHSAQPTQQRSSNPSANNRREQTTHSSQPAAKHTATPSGNNNRQAQPAQQHNAKQSPQPRSANQPSRDERR